MLSSAAIYWGLPAGLAESGYILLVIIRRQKCERWFRHGSSGVVVNDINKSGRVSEVRK